MRAGLLGVSVPPSTPQSASNKENHTQSTLGYKLIGPLGQATYQLLYLFLPHYPYLHQPHGSVPFSVGQVTSCLFGDLCRSGEGASCFPEYSCSHRPASTSCLVDPPILPAWPISVLLKYMIDRIQTILPQQASREWYYQEVCLFRIGVVLLEEVCHQP